MEGRLMEDSSLQELKIRMEDLEKRLEAEMLLHNSQAVRALQQQLDKLQGEYNGDYILCLDSSLTLSIFHRYGLSAHNEPAYSCCAAKQ